MTCTSAFAPVFQPQNPAISGYRYGWYSCAAFAGAEAASYATCGVQHPTGMQVRNLTNEAIPDTGSPGLTITQVADALARLGIKVVTFNRMAWTDVEAHLAAGSSVSLCVGYSVIRPTRFTGDPNFYGNHQIWVPPTFKVMDPLADGRRSGIYKYHGEVYPRSMVRLAAGAFRVSYGPIGLGYAQGFYTTAHPAPVSSHRLSIAAGTTSILTANFSGSCIASWTKHSWGGGASSAPCDAPEYRKGCSSGGASVVHVTAGAFAGKYVRIGGGVSVV